MCRFCRGIATRAHVLCIHGKESRDGQRREELVSLIGLIWAVAAPLLLLVPNIALSALLRRRGWQRPKLLACAIVLVPVAAVYAYDRAEFSALCREIGRPVITTRAVADGIYLNSGTANSFGTRYLSQEGFSWLERRDIYVRGGLVRVTRDDAGLYPETKIPALTARYEVLETHETRAPNIGISRTKVIDRQTGTEMSRAGDANFLGGRMSMVLGVYGSSSGLSAMSDPAGFRGYYHLARDTLRP